MNTTAQDAENTRWREVIRLMQLTRDESVDSLLSAALGGRESTVDSVTKLYHFALRNFGSAEGLQPSTVTRKFWNAASAFFREAGLSPEQIEKIRRPFPDFSEPGFESVLTEFEERS